jgi:hypothetical protein
MKKPKPHVSAALAHLRPGVTCASMAVAICVIAQLLVFGFVHFTEVRYEVPSAKATENVPQPLSVVPAVKIEPRRDLHGAGAQPDTPTPPAHAEPRRLSQYDRLLRMTSDMAAALGIASAVSLFMLIFLGVIVAGSASVPGVEKAVSACTWAMVLAIVCLPWRHLVPMAPFPGVFSGYTAMTDAAAGAKAGSVSTGALLGTYLVLPAAALVVGFMILARFRDGIAAGVIIQSVSELDLAIEREAGEIARRGISVSGPRAVGALNSAIGATPTFENEPPPRRPVRGEEHAGPAEPMPKRTADGLTRPAPTRERRYQPADEDDDGYRRPI